MMIQRHEFGKWSKTRGSVSIEAVLIIPAFLIFLALIVAIGRTAAAHTDIHAAAVEGSRIASLATSSTAADSTAKAAITAHLVRESVHCTTLNITIEAAALDKPPGQYGQVQANITCAIPLSDLAVPGLPGSIKFTESFKTAIDAYTNR